MSRRWGRNYIDGIEIGIQRQDLSDIELALTDRRSIGRLRLDGELAFRAGIGLFGAQGDEPDQPAILPTARYRITTVDIGATLPFSDGLVESWRVALRGQYSGRTLYGSDSFSIGGPFTVRGYDSDRADIGRSGWYSRQELSFRLAPAVRPYVLADMGAVERGTGLFAGVGAGVRAGWRGFSLDAFVAAPVTKRSISTGRPAQLGFTLGWGF
ncbi:ShlB/FhaC/HecB family hemolysin secretion/activation protein [uncultured Sphingomonas sp.]|uniref:ShlB/FhaC/HecB family hemolysin secretion/activation protein n=1 Tax=uncultured Sphingomonas sp. TaxID=158754 RepID=UPI0025DF75D0|nr:ShlB/FhaC/HecB family hemolysin secretion/activation protein [uncultured Sphingomonas sp.]